jgi:hypothetical protein
VWYWEVEREEERREKLGKKEKNCLKWVIWKFSNYEKQN